MSPPARRELSFHLDVCWEHKTLQMQGVLNRKECYLFQFFITWFTLALWFSALPSFMKDEDSGTYSGTYTWNQESLPCNQKKSKCDRWKSQQGFMLRTRFSKDEKDKYTHACIWQSQRLFDFFEPEAWSMKMKPIKKILGGKLLLFLENYLWEDCPFISCFRLSLMQPRNWQNRSKETSENKLIKLLCQLGVLTPTTLIMFEAGEGLECQQQ